MEKIIAFRINRHIKMGLIPASSRRDWMNHSQNGFANRCLPMRIANQAGWLLLNDRSLRAKWFGGVAPNSVVIEQDGDPPYVAISHFGGGVLTFMLPFLFRTPPGMSLLFRGPANAPKDSIGPLEGLVETAWSVAGVSMNWQFTRADTWVEFSCGEPICMIVPQQLATLEAVRPIIRNLASDNTLLRHHNTWRDSCLRFTDRLQRREPEAIRQGWQRYYFCGTAPHAGSDPIPEAEEHRTKLSLRAFVFETPEESQLSLKNDEGKIAVEETL